ncbi:MAG TPA: MBL fold metallo-hydrolase [bacterium]|nr:MBL fold metallo-hydrolase [bacterium]
MHLVDTEGARLLLDCGLFQGRREEAARINSALPFDAADLDAVVLSHAHLDHCGNLPTLVRAGFRGPIYCTPATRDLADLILQDSAKVQRQDAEHVNKLRSRTGLPPVAPLYTADDAARAIERLRAVPYHEVFEIGPARVTFYDAGHILGSAITVVETDGRRLAFTGDLGRPGGPILRDPEVPPAADLLIMESTYGDRAHEPLEGAAGRLGTVVGETAARGGTELIPAFAVGRTQDVTYALHRLRNTGAVPSIPTFVDSPMAVDATEIFRRHPECFGDETRRMLAREDPFGFKGLTYVREVADSKTLNSRAGPFIVIATSGMCESGRILHHLAHRIGDARCSLVLVGFQAQHTLGRRLETGVSPVNIFGEPHDVRLQVREVAAFSAHADAAELTAWVARLPRVGRIYCVHGEEPGSLALAAALRARGYAADMPTRGQQVDAAA